MAIPGVGTIFRRWNSTLGAWENIGQINSITGPGMKRDTIDTTALDTEGGYKTFIASFRDPGTVDLEMNFQRNTFELMKADFEIDTPVNYQIVLPDIDQTSLSFEGLVTELPLDIKPDDKVSSKVVIQISGPVNLESGSGPSPG